MTAASVIVAEHTAVRSGVAFGSLIDIARLQAGTSPAEICEACNTINMGAARQCKCCSHKLPTFYAVRNSGETMSPTKQTRIAHAPSWGLDFAAFWVVISLLVVITKFIPIP